MSWWDRVKQAVGGITKPMPPPPPEPEPAPAPKPASSVPPEPALPPEPPPPLLRDAALEAAIAAAPDATAPYLVYADWLQERGDPRGELIALHVAMEAAADHAAFTAAAERARQLIDRHGPHLVGPAEAKGLEAELRYGFVHRVEQWDRDAKAALADVIASDHPALRFLAVIQLRDGESTEAVRVLLEEHGRSGVRVVAGRRIELAAVRRVQASVACRADKAGGFAVDVSMDPAVDGMADHAYIVRTTAGGLTWWFGSGAALTEEPIGDDPPFSGTGYLAERPHDLRIDMRLRITDDDGTQTLHLTGATTLDAATERTALLLRACEPLAGLPFEHSPIAAVTTACGPVLIGAGVEPDARASYNTMGAALPGVGVFNTYGGVAIVGESGRVALSPPAARDGGYLGASYAGANGALALAFNGSVPKFLPGLVFLRAPTDSSREANLRGGIVTALFDPPGARLAAITYAPEHGTELAVFDVDAARELARTALPFLTDTSYALAWRGDTAIASGDGRSYALAADGSVTTTAIPRATGIGWRQYGAGTPTYHPLLDRTAWMMCVEFAGADHPATTIIAWRDGGGAHGGVAVPDEGWGQDHHDFGKVVVLDDGRILAIGTRIWLVDPKTDGVRDLGEASSYTDSPLVVDGKLYAKGVGPWWTALD